MSGPIARAILLQTAADHGLPLAAMLQKSRSPDRVAARFDAMRRLRAVTWRDGRPRFSLPQIGEMLGLHHTSVLNGLRRMEALSLSSSSPLSPSFPPSSSPHVLRGSGHTDGREFHPPSTTIPRPRNKSEGDGERGSTSEPVGGL